MTQQTNVLVVGATRRGKSLSAAADACRFPGAVVIGDPHKDSFARTALMHLPGNVLYEQLSDLRHTLGFELLRPSENADPLLRQHENQRRAEAFVEILLRRRDADGMAGTPLMEEWVMAAIMLYLCQRARKPLTHLPFRVPTGHG